MFTDLWVDKYKPKSLDEITGNKEIINRLKVISKSRNLPNMILFNEIYLFYYLITFGFNLRN